MRYIYTGKQIKALMGMPVKTVHTETAKHAYKSLMDSYGSITDESHYYHAGQGKWKRHNGTTAGNQRFTAEMLKNHVELSRRTVKKIPKAEHKAVTKVLKPKLSSKLSGLKAPSKPINRSEKTALNGSNKPVLKHTKTKISEAKLKSQAKPTPRTKKIQTKQKPVLKHIGALYNGAYMKNSPFTKEQVLKYNAYTFNEQDINKHFNNEMQIVEKEARDKYPNGLPADVIKALAYYRKALYEYHNEWGRASRVAPSTIVVGPANYKGKPERADGIRRNAIEKLDLAKKKFKTALVQSQVKIDRQGASKAYNVKPGDKVILHWTNNFKKYAVPANVVRVNVNTLVGRLTGNVNGYDIGQEISVPMIGTKDNRWEHAGSNKPVPPTKKEAVEQYYKEHPVQFKVGDRVKNLFHGEGVVTKVNKQTMVIKIPKQYEGDSCVRKVGTDTKTNTKL